MDTPLTFPTWANVFTFVSGILSTVIVLLVKSWLDSKKTVSEIHHTQSQTQLTQVQIRSTELRDDLATGEGVGRMLGNLIEAGDQLSDLQQQVFELKGRTLRAEADADMAQLFIEQLHAAAKLKGVHLADFTPDQLKRAKDHTGTGEKE